MNDADNDVAYGGAYLEVGQTLSRSAASGAPGPRAAASTSAAARSARTDTGFGVAGRLSAELYVSGVGIEPRGLFLGTYAIGVYVEVGARDLGDDVGAVHVSGGLTFRTPLVFSP